MSNKVTGAIFCGIAAILMSANRGENYFVPDGCKTPFLYTKKSIEKAGAIPVSADSISSCEANWNTTYLCPKCRKFIADY